MSTKIIAKLLFANPWMNVEQITALTGMERSSVLETINRARLFSKQALPVSKKMHPRNWDNFYALTSYGEGEFIGLHRNPLLVEGSKIQTFSHITHVRNNIVTLNEAYGGINWLVSPYAMRIDKTLSGTRFDAVFSMDREPGWSTIITYVAPQLRMPTGWYVNLVKKWVSWKKRIPQFPASLVIWNPLLSKDALMYLNSKVFYEGNGYITVSRIQRMERKNRWFYLNKETGISTTDIPPWQTIYAIPTNLLPQEPFIKFKRKRSYIKKGSTNGLDEYLQEKDPDFLADADICAELKASEINVLWQAAHYPMFEKGLLATLSNMDETSFPNKLQALERLGLLTSKRIQQKKRYLITEIGISVLSRMFAIKPEEMKYFLGYINKALLSESELGHTVSILNFFEQLATENSLVSWNMMGARARYYGIPGLTGNKKFNISIHPDSVGIVRLPGNDYRGFWFELDRGNRRGKRLFRQLEKYYLALFAESYDIPVYPLVYVIDTPDGGEMRLQGIRNKLDEVARKFPNANMRFIMTTQGLIDNHTSKGLVKTKIWRVYKENTYFPDLVTLSEAFS